MYDVYTEVSQYIEWIEMTILDNGGMASCGYMLTASPTHATVGGTASLTLSKVGRFLLVSITFGKQ